MSSFKVNSNSNSNQVKQLKCDFCNPIVIISRL
jgi:hypothetical protein